MEFKLLKTKKEKLDFIKFYYSVYKRDESFVDTDVFVLKDMLFEKTQIARDMTLIPLAIFNNDIKACQCILFASLYADELFLGYFDALEHKYAEVEFLLKQAQKIAAEMGKNKVIIGINGHISCGIGILQDNFDKKATFDSRYSKSYYKDYFSHLPSRGLTTYIQAYKQLKRYNAGSENTGKFACRFLNPEKFDSEMEKFSILCNETLCGTDFYYAMKPYHMKNMLMGMKIFLKNENLIFLTEGEREIGFLFWHPDYNELFKAGKKNNLLSVFFRFLTTKIKKCKINAVGVLKEYRNTRAFMVLINAFAKLAVGYEHIETTFIWDNNKESSVAASKRMDAHKHYRVYELEV